MPRKKNFDKHIEIISRQFVGTIQRTIREMVSQELADHLRQQAINEAADGRKAKKPRKPRTPKTEMVVGQAAAVVTKKPRKTRTPKAEVAVEQTAAPVVEAPKATRRPRVTTPLVQRLVAEDVKAEPVKAEPVKAETPRRRRKTNATNPETAVVTKASNTP